MQEAKSKRSRSKRKTGGTPSLNVRWILFLLIFLFFLSSPAPAFQQTDEGMLDYSLDVSFDIPSSIVKGIVTIPVKEGQAIRLDKGRLNLLDVALDKERLHISGQRRTIEILSPREGTLEIVFEGIFQSHERGQNSNVIDSRGICLTGRWYPKPDQMCRYHLRATLPHGFEAISEAESIEKAIEDGNTFFIFDFPYPLDSINFIANERYRIVKDRLDGVEIFAYFFPEDLDLAKTYIEHAKQYLHLYDHLISRFPYKRFSIVENFLPTGYSMPTYTLLGQEVLRLPFIAETSLGHETLHQWFGNLVYIDAAKGNWAEGLTTFLADHLYKEGKGQGQEYRKESLINYQSYVNEKNEFPLRDFRQRTDDASEAIGYGKALMVFQMLKKMVGEARFYESLKYFTAENRFRNASWEDIETAFEKFYQKDLNWFFNQWIDENGLPHFELEEVQVRPSGTKFEVNFTVIQKEKVYTLDLPVVVYSHFGKTTRVVQLQSEKDRFTLIVDDVPERIALDEDYDVARTLSINEFPPVIARLIGDEKRAIVLPPSGFAIYEEVIDALRGNNGIVIKPDQIGYEDLGNTALVILGADNPVVGRLFGAVPSHGGFSVLIKDNPRNRKKVVGIFEARSKDEVHAALQKIFHYGKYSAVAFDHGVNVYKRIDGSIQGIVKELFKRTRALESATVKTLPEAMECLSGKKIIYVGETHDQFPHHVTEQEIIKDLHRRGKKIAIGMEMFQRPFQEVLDDYIEGKIDEREFLKGTQYFKRWGFDYNLYRPILLFARAEKIPVVALNMRQEIVDKVFRSGLDSLSEEEKKVLPSQMDFSDDAYKERLQKIFQEHEDFGARSFEFFYQAQILWDETMSESVDNFLRVDPSYQMVVLAGRGHLEYGSGIPKRTARRNSYNSAIVLNDVAFISGIADYILFSKAIPAPTSPKLMVLLSEEKGKVEIVGFPGGSNSEKAGMKVGDVILLIDHTPIHDIDDVKIDLLFRQRGEKVKVRVLRTSFFESQQEMDFEVALQ